MNLEHTNLWLNALTFGCERIFENPRLIRRNRWKRDLTFAWEMSIIFWMTKNAYCNFCVLCHFLKFEAYILFSLIPTYEARLFKNSLCTLLQTYFFKKSQKLQTYALTQRFLQTHIILCNNIWITCNILMACNGMLCRHKIYHMVCHIYTIHFPFINIYINH